MPTSKKYTLLSGILLLVFAFFTALKKETIGMFYGNSSSKQKPNGLNHSGDNRFPSTETYRGGRRTVSPRNNTHPAPTHSYPQLKNFYLHPVKLRGVSFRQALSTVVQNYRRACRKTGENPIRFGFNYDPSVPDHPLTMNLPNGSFDQQLRLLCAAAGVKLKRDNNTLSFQSVANEDDSGADPEKLYVRAFPPPRELYSKLRFLSGIDTNFEQDDPFAADHVLSISSHQLIQKILPPLEAREDTFTNYIPASEVIVARNTRTELDRYDTLLKTLHEYPEQYIRTMNQIITFPVGHDIELNDLQDVKEIAAEAGSEILTLPSVISRPNEHNSIEITTQHTTPHSNKSDWTGIKLTGSTTRVGFGVEYNYQLQTGELPKQDGGEFDYDINPVQSTQPINQYLISRLPDEDGRQRYIVVASQHLDVTGQPIDEDKERN